MNFSFFTGLSSKNSRQSLEESIDQKEFVDKLKKLLNVKSEEDFENKLKNIFLDKKRCALFCKRLGHTTESFVKLLIEANVEYMYQPRTISLIKRVHFSEND